MSKTVLLATTVLALSLGACSFKKSSDDAKPAAPATTTPTQPADEDKLLEQKQLTETEQATITADDVKVSFAEEDAPKAYRLNVSWPERAQHIALQFRSKAANAQFDDPRYFNYRSSYSDSYHSGDTFDLKLTTFDGHNQVVSSITKEDLKVPADIVFDEALTLHSDTNISANRIYFNVNGYIDTNGYALSLSGNTLIAPQQPTAEKYQIVTVDKNADAINDSRFKNGSNIAINVKKATGYMRIQLIGIDGLAGRSGAELERISNYSVPASYNGANGRDGVVYRPKFHACRGDFCDPGTPTCQTPPTNGADGRTGDAGAPGEAGSPGGSTGNLIFLAEDSSNLSLLVAKHQGLGGIGGKGALGHSGGSGGQAGNPTDTKYCPSARNGNAGATGANGTDGASGAAGAMGDIQCSSLEHFEEQTLR